MTSESSLPHSAIHVPRCKVLIVDDVESVRIGLGAFVEKDGHDVSLAEDASQALALLREKSFDVVVTDIILPRKTGVVLLGEIREMQPDVQVIMITGEPEINTAAEAVRRGAFDYLSKPVSREDITRVVSAAAAKKTLLDKNRLLEDENRRYREHLEELVDARTKQLQDSERTLRESQEIAKIGQWRLDLLNEHLDWSKGIYDLFEIDPDGFEATYDAFLDAVHPEDRDRVDAAYAASIASKLPYDITHRLLLKNGTVKYVRELCRTEYDQSGRPVLSIGTVQDISDIKRSEQQTKRLLDQQTCINELALELGNVSDIHRIYESVYRHVTALMDAKSFIISFYDEEEQLLRAGCALFQDKVFDASKLPPIPLAQEGHGTQSQVICTGEPLYVPDYRKARKKGKTEYTVDSNGIMKKGPPPEEEDDITRSALFVPLKLEGRVIGVMQVQSNRLDGYTEDNMVLLSGLANVAAVAIANSRLVQEIHNALEGTVHIIGDTVEIRDPYTAGHQRRVTELACAIARSLSLPEERIDGLRVAGLLHDIGKMAIPAEILSKPTSLTEIEFSLIKDHPQVAYGLLESIRFQWPVAQIVLQHHERMDGSGYPNELKEAEILLEARILGVADTVEAMAAHRPYRAALGIDAALEEITRNKGKLYFEEAVDACLQLFASEEFSFEEQL